MIHHTLLPKSEIKSLRREYRTRFFIIALFFVSCAIVFGIIMLVPSYLYTKAEELQTAVYERELEESRKASGAADIEKNLIMTQMIAERVAGEKVPHIYTDLIKNIISLRPPQIVFSSFEVIKPVSTTTGPTILVQGKATTREILIAFQKSLESDSNFTEATLPLSDLAKSRNIAFIMTVFVKFK